MTELQDRLEHLVNYSSQLIFVSGDTVAQQQRTLEDFISVQKENTEIAYFTAERNMEAPDYRRKICQQLIGQQVGSYVRALTILLKDLQAQPGPFLVCIKQAQYLPNDFLQELWDWVIQSRKQSDKQHLNVILFGETKWAEQAKKWLPNKNSSKPVLLSSHSVNSSAFDSNALATLMADNRTFFNTRLFGNADERKTLLTNRAFILSILLVFLIVFTGIISWQYPGYVRTFLSTGSLPTMASMQQDNLDQNLESAIIQPSNSDLSAQSLPTPELQIVEEDPFNATDILVSTWNKLANDESKDAIGDDSTRQKNEPEPDANLQPTIPAGDFAVPDIINVEQLDAVLGNQLLNQSYEQAPMDTSLALTPSKTDSAAAINNYSFDEEALLSLPDNAILLQLSGIQNPSVLEEYIRDNNLQESTWIYRTQRYGGPWFVVLYKQSFPNLAAARAGTNALPSNIRSSEPFAKVAAQVKQEIQNQ